MARILIDMDGILCDLVKKWFSVYNADYQENLRLEQMRQWGPHHYAKRGRAIYRYLTQPGFFLDLEPIPGAIAGVRQLLAWGHDVVVVTAAKNGHADKLSWLRQHLPFLDYHNVVFAHRKELVRGDVLFDDSPLNLAAFSAYGLPVAMAYPYNEGCAGVRVGSWQEFLHLVKERFGVQTDDRRRVETVGAHRSTDVPVLQPS